MTNRSTKAISRQAQAAAPILHPASPDYQSNIIHHRPLNFRSPSAFTLRHFAAASAAPSVPWDTTGQFARAFCPQRVSVLPTNQRPSGVQQRTIRAAIVRANRVSNFAVRRNQRTAKELRLTHGNGSGQNAKNPEPQSHLSVVCGVRPDNSRNESRQPDKAESGGSRAESQSAAATRASPPFPLPPSPFPLPPSPFPLPPSD